MSAPSDAPAAFFFRSVRCPQCGTTLGAAKWEDGEAVRCPGCRSRLGARLFPALRQPPATGLAMSAGAHATEGEAACFFHPGKKAERSCDRCGRFICALCDLPLGVRHVCPTCLGSGLGTAKLPELVSRRVHWPRLAFAAGLLPLLLGAVVWPLLFVTGPAAVLAAIYGWKKPPSLVRGRQRSLAALGAVLGLAQLAGVVAFIVLIWKGHVGL